MTNVNYMQVMPGGHCLICHKDYEKSHLEHHKDSPSCLPAEGYHKATECTDKCPEKWRVSIPKQFIK